MVGTGNGVLQVSGLRVLKVWGLGFKVLFFGLPCASALPTCELNNGICSVRALAQCVIKRSPNPGF